MLNFSTTYPNVYAFIWSKYRPALLRLMIDAAKEPQTYKFSNHEFLSVNPREKGGHTFTMAVHKGKSISNIRSNIVAQDLLGVLQSSNKAFELMGEHIYEFIMDKHFLLHITRQDPPKEENEESTEKKVTPEATSEKK